MNEGEYVRRMAFCIVHLTETRGVMNLELSFEIAVQIIASLQLTLRHPQLPPECRKTMRQLVDNWIGTLEDACPEIGPLLRVGDDPAGDITL